MQDHWGILICFFIHGYCGRGISDNEGSVKMVGSKDHVRKPLRR